MIQCPNCEKYVNKLVDLPNADATAGWAICTDTVTPIYDSVCINCVHRFLGIYPGDLIAEERLRRKNETFQLNLLKGRIGQIVIESVFSNFGYELFPYGYESYLTGIIKDLQKGNSNQIVKQIRSTPDSLVYDRELNQAFLIEVKSTEQDIHSYWIASETIKNYKESWGGALLVILHIPTFKIYCKNIAELDTSDKESKEMKNNSTGFVFNLDTDFKSFSTEFRLINEIELNAYLKRIKNELLKNYGS